jgi:hypothetical protein
VPADHLVLDAGVKDRCDRFVGAMGLSAEWGSPALVRRGFISRRTPMVVVTSLVIGATRAAAFSPGIRAGTKPGQMTAGPGDWLDHELHLGNGAISDRIRASAAYAPEQPAGWPSVRSEDGAKA